VVAVAVAVCAAGGACVDLFHSTNFETLCDVDAAACPEAGSADAAEEAALDGGEPDGPTDFCSWEGGTALENARRACAWLGACAGPFGENALGPCMVNATLVYDCEAAPSRKAIRAGQTHAYWDALWQADSCSDVLQAIQPNKGTMCLNAGESYFACTDGGEVTVACGASDASTGTSPPLGLESCAAAGQTCVAPSAANVCVGPTTCAPGAGLACADPVNLQDCDDAGVDHGMSCAGVGAGKCSDAGVAACLAVGGQVCTPTTTVTCDGGVAQGCPSGQAESVDCNALLGERAGCNADAGGRPWDVSRACVGDINESCGAETDSCSDAGAVTGCARGVAFSVTCSEYGLGPCAATNLPGNPAACTPPDAG
jgi:hypothetical protein